MSNSTNSGGTNIRTFDTIGERDLHAYVDGQLDARRSRQVEAYLARNPEIAAEIQDYITYNDLLGSVGNELDKAPVPPHLLNTLRKPGRSATWTGVTRAAAVIALCLFSAAGGWIAATQQTPGQGNAKMAEAARESVSDKPGLAPPIEATPEKTATRDQQKKIATGAQNQAQGQNSQPGDSKINTKTIQLPTRILQP